MRRVVFSGPESSGKTHLSRWLAAALPGAVWLPEYTRVYCAEHGTDTDLHDVQRIAAGQRAQEQAEAQQQPDWLVLDTSLLSNILWSDCLFGQVPPQLWTWWAQTTDDVHFVCAPEGVVWQADAQRCQAELSQRVAFFQAACHHLQAAKRPFVVLSGDMRQRQRQIEATWLSLFGQTLGAAG